MTEPLLIHKIFANIVFRFPEKIAFEIKREAGWESFTYKEIQAGALKVAVFLLKEGFKKGDFAALILENRPEWAVIYLGIIWAGLTCVPVDVQLTCEELANIIDDSGARIIFTSYSLYQHKINQNIKDRLKKVVILDLEKESLEPLVDFSRIKHIAVEGVAFPDIAPEEVASLIYTSGTTAKPKGVILTQRNLCSNFRSIEKLEICFASDNFLSILPLHHTYPFMVTLLLPLFTGATVTYCASFKPEDLSSIVKEKQVTVLVGVPQLFALLHKAIFERIKKIPPVLRPLILPLIKNKIHCQLGKSLRLLVSGGARLPARIAVDLSRLGFRIIEGYGLTETSPVVTFNPPKKIKFGSVGKPIPNVEIKILNPDKSGIGEVLIKGPNVMPGYFNRPQATAEVLKDGWFHSGDLGFIDKEGYLFLTGRAKDVIVLSSGKNIYPEELEEFFISQSPYLKEVCILPVKDYRFGQEVESLYAVIVPNIEYFRKNNEINIQDKLRWEIDNISKKLPSYQHIMGFYISKEGLPRTQLNKIKRYQIKEKFQRQRLGPEEVKETAVSAEDAELLKTELAGKVIDYLAKELKKRVDLSSHLEIDLGIDSLSRVELGLGLEELLKIKIPQGLIEKVFSVKELIIDLEKAMQAPVAAGQEEALAEKKSWSEMIKASPPEEICASIKLGSSFLDRLLTFLFKSFFLFIFRLVWSLRIEASESIPKDTPYILCPNHASYLDGFVLFSSLPLNSAGKLFFVGLAAIFKNPWVAWAIKMARLIPIDPSTHLTEAMQATSYVLRHKKAVCIFPEGRRAISAEVQDFKKGIGILAKELDIPIVPVYIAGSHDAWPRTSRLPRPHPLKIIFGRPLNWRDLGSDYESIAAGLREEVLKLQKELTKPAI